MRLQRLTREIEALVPDIQAALKSSRLSPGDGFLGEEATSLVRAATAVKKLADQVSPPSWTGANVRELLEGAEPLRSLFGSRLVIARKRSRKPSIAARAPAVLLEEPTREFDTAEVARRLGCTEAVARTTLNRLVRSGHAARLGIGRFRAKRR